ncbi:MAG: hypothetical protein ACR2GD_00255 [Pyrinomonadaceae bacterium]
MADYKEKFEEWQRAAKEKFEEIDNQLGIKDKLEEGAKAFAGAAQKGAETLKDGAQKIKTEAEKTQVGKQAVRAAEDTVKTASETAKKAWDASASMRASAEDAGEKAADAFGISIVEAEKIVKEAGRKAGEVLNVAGEKASEVFEDASRSFKKTGKAAAGIFNLGASWTRTFDSAFKTFQKTTDWIAESPLQAAATGVSVVVGASLGAGFTFLSSNWFFNSALPMWSVKKVSEKFDDYLKEQEELVKKGDLSEAEAGRIRFEREIIKYVGAPLLGAFSCGAGAMMWANIFSPKTITGAPVDWILRGNPVLEGVWLFGNGIVCFKTGYDFFMIALDDHAEIQRIVKELKGLLPQATVSEG